MEPTVLSPDNLGQFSQLVIQAAADGKWPMLAALALVGVVWGLRRFVVPQASYFQTKEGGVILNLLTSFAGAVGTMLIAPGVNFTWGLMWTAFQLSVGASGIWTLFGPLVEKYIWPLLLRVPFLAKLFARGDATRVISEAEKKGLAAAATAKTPKSEDIANAP